MPSPKASVPCKNAVRCNRMPCSRRKPVHYFPTLSSQPPNLCPRTRTTGTAQTLCSQSKRVPSRLRVAPDSLSAGLITQFVILLFKSGFLLGHVPGVLCRVSSGLADATGELADGGLERLVEYLADGIPDY